jgi:plasmid stabilization system protein ParE
MELKVTWTKTAKVNYIKILDDIVSEFGDYSGQEYAERVDKMISLLQSFPELGAKQNLNKDLYAIILYRRTTIFYTFNAEGIKIVNVIDNRRNF